MAAEKKWTDVFVDICGLLMKEVGMPSPALAELRCRANAITTTKLESFQSIMFWKSATVNFFDLQEKFMELQYSKNFPAPVSDTFVIPVSDKTHIPDLNEPPVPDLNKPPPQNEIQDHGKMVEAGATSATSKRKTAQANHSIKKPKFTQETAGPSTRDRGKGIPEMEGWAEN